MSDGRAGAGGAAAGNPDRAYCATALDALTRLESVSRRRNDVRRELETKVAHRRAVWSSTLALVVAAAVWLFFLLAQPEILGTGDYQARLGSLLTRCFALLLITVLLSLVGFVLANALWGTRLLAPLRERDARRLREAHLRERARVDAQAEAILAEPVLREGRIPAKFLAPNLVVILIRLFDSGQATFLEAAVYMLEMEIANTAYYSNIVPAQTLVDREREQIAEDRREEVPAHG